ncbi:DUF2480 family protein [Mangrovivirga cuniculi]|uniref:DUF2480 domain-containing protein n=1 Tax=Mangrovivirga cuniculi TaxID=2715131 RepID=A0A4D7JSJ6_9BACT|nr:DUF2480 family protein [Mangrovivirga cuniculi]QCK13915.1 hypothetical protein DCC35_03630 [Mangrovivirga cuniculi]
MAEEIINRVAKSPLVTIDLEELYDHRERIGFDLKDLLFQELILKEKDFRQFVKEHEWSQYQDKHFALFCSADAIVPTWAYMIIASKLKPYAATVSFSSLEKLEEIIFEKIIDQIDAEEYREKKIVIKGCSKLAVPTSAYVRLTEKLTPVVSSIMYGEPCSTVPVYKKPKK